MALLDRFAALASPYYQPLVIVVLAVMCAIVAARAVPAQLRFARERRRAKAYAKQVAAAIKRNDWAEVLTLSDANAKQTYLARVILAGLKERDSLKERLPPNLLPRHLTLAMEREVLAVQHEHESHLGVIDAIGRTAPFVGALGGSPTTLLIGTAIALPTIWFATHLRSSSALISIDMKYVASELTALVESQGASLAQG